MVVNTLYCGEDKRACLLEVLKWAKLEGFESKYDPGYLEDVALEIEADYALDWLNQHVPDYIYDLEAGNDGWFFTRLLICESVIECD